MAIDTAAKRFSMLGIDLPMPLALPVPSGAITTARPHWLRKYLGIAWTAIVGPNYGTEDLTTAVSFYLPTLLPGDQTSEFRAYADGVRNSTGITDDLNTAIDVDLNH